MIFAAHGNLSVSLRFYPEHVACANRVGSVVRSPVLGPPRSCEIQPSVSQCEWGGELEEAPWAVDKSADAHFIPAYLTPKYL